MKTDHLQLDIEQLGQVFTPFSLVEKMLRLRRNRGRILEPSAGNGSFLSQLGKDAVGIEIDKELIQDRRVIASDFFAYSTDNKFNTIIGNPPYVRYQDIRRETKALLPMEGFDKRSNLYLFFIAKCMEHLAPGGELIFITPRNFLKSTNARELNRKLYEQGSITHYYELGDNSLFAKYSPNCAVWRWEKGRRDRNTKTGGKFRYKNGQLWFGDASHARLGDYFAVKVGAVSGADRIFTNDKRGCTDFVCSITVKNGTTRRMIYNRKDRSLEKHKQVLMNRRIRRFDATNWWQWGRKYYRKEGWRIYVNCKTRNNSPFFTSKISAYDGSVLAIFPKTDIDVHKAAEKLNRVSWEKLGFVCDGRFLFTQKSLENAPLELAL